MEVGEILFELEEVFEEENFVDGTCTVEIVHFAVAHVLRFEQVHDLCTKGSHTGTTADPNHFALRIVARMEITIRAAHHHLVAGLEAEDVGRSDTGHHIEETGALVFRFERRRGNTHGERDDIAFVGIVGHGVGTNRGFGVHTLQTEEAELLPSGEIQIADQALVDVLVIVHRESGDLNLGVRTGFKIHVLSGRQLHLKLLDEGGYVAVADHGAFPLLDTHHTFGDFDGQIAFHFRLAAQTPVVLDFFAGEVSLFGVENLAAAFDNLALALSARTFTAACGRQVDTVLRERGEQAGALLHFERFFSVDREFHVAGRRKIVFGDEEDDHQHNDDGKEDANTGKNKSCIHRVVEISDLDFETGEAHEGHCHQPHGDERDAETLERLRHVSVGHFFADGGKGYDGQKPADARTERIDEGVPHAADGLCARGGIHQHALLHEERRTHDGAVHRNEGKENTQRRVERRRKAFDGHFHQLCDTGDDCNEKNEREEAQIHTFNDAIGVQHVDLQEIVDGDGHQQHKGDCDAEPEGRFYVLRYGQVRAHTEEERKYHIVHKNRADEKT